MKDLGAFILSVGGICAAIVGSISYEGPMWGSRIMLLTNLICAAVALSRRRLNHADA